MGMGLRPGDSNSIVGDKYGCIQDGSQELHPLVHKPCYPPDMFKLAPCEAGGGGLSASGRLALDLNDFLLIKFLFFYLFLSNSFVFILLYS